MSLLYIDIANKIKEYIDTNNRATKLPTEREFALKYNVSRQTVRNALSICEEEGLIERRQGSGIYLSSKYIARINKIALIIPNDEDYIYPVIINRLEEMYSSLSFSLDIYYTNYKIKKEKDILELLMLNPVSILIVYQHQNALPTPLSDKYQLIKQQGTKIVFIGAPSSNLFDFNYIQSNDFNSGYNCGKYITDNNQNWCAIFIHDNLSSVNRYYGFIQYLEDNSIEYDENNIHWISYKQLLSTKRNPQYYIRDIITNYTTLPLLYILGHEQITFDLAVHLNNTKSLTEEIQIVSFDCNYLNNFSNVKIHSFDMNIDVLCTSLISLTTNNKKEKEVITLPSTLHD